MKNIFTTWRNDTMSLIFKSLSLVFFFLSLYCTANRSGNYETLKDGNIISYVLKDHQIIITAIPEITDFSDNHIAALSLEDLARRSPFRYAINASYFTFDNGRYGHAGYLFLNGNRINSRGGTKQLTHIFCYDRAKGKAVILPADNFIAPPAGTAFAFQTGPAIVINNKTAESYIDHSLNGKAMETRSALAVLDQKKIFFITVNEFITLRDLAKLLLDFSEFKKGDLNVVSLDGGSSVACYSKKYPQLNSNTDFPLPYYLIVK